jgi:hypothetical protein
VVARLLAPVADATGRPLGHSLRHGGARRGRRPALSAPRATRAASSLRAGHRGPSVVRSALWRDEGDREQCFSSSVSRREESPLEGVGSDEDEWSSEMEKKKLSSARSRRRYRRGASRTTPSSVYHSGPSDYVRTRRLSCSHVRRETKSDPVGVIHSEAPKARATPARPSWRG